MKKKYSEIESECVFWKEHSRSEQDINSVHIVGEQWTNGSCHSGQVRRKLCSICERHSAQVHGESEDNAQVDENHLNIARKCKKEDTVASSSHMNYGPFTKLQHEYYVCCKHSHSVRR
jgi:hypothetical protein